MTLSRERPMSVAVMSEVLRSGRDRCCYCQRKGATRRVLTTVTGLPVDNLVAHDECDEPVQAWRRARM